MVGAREATAPREDPEEAAAVLRQQRIDPRIATNDTRPSEQIPWRCSRKFEQLKSGDVVLYPLNNGVVIAQVKRCAPSPSTRARRSDQSSSSC